MPVLNRRAQIFSFWQLKISLSQSGRIVGRASITNAPMYSSSNAWSVKDALSVASDVLLLLLTLLHTLSVCGLVAPAVNYVMRYLKPQKDDISAAALAMPEQAQQPSRWFQLLCQLSCAALTIGVILGMWLNSSVLRYAMLCYALTC